jgi:hypothetical protein
MLDIKAIICAVIFSIPLSFIVTVDGMVNSILLILGLPAKI